MNPWLGPIALVRTWHSIDVDVCRKIPLNLARRDSLISGAINPVVYPIRTEMVAWAKMNPGQIYVLEHPGYGNQGSATSSYLRTIANYKAHLTTCSIYGFALRKIIETVAMGSIPVTNLPDTDRLPWIDKALWRLPANLSAREIAWQLRDAAHSWTIGERLDFAKLAALYDYRLRGLHLDAAISRFRKTGREE
jgi:hypothetical protein